VAKASKKDKDLQQKWEDRLNRAKKVRKSWKDLFQVDLAKDFFDGKQKDNSYSDDDWITVNMIYSHVKAQLPALYSADPFFYVKLERCFKADPQIIVLYEQKAKIRQAYLNYLKKELALKPKIRLMIQDALFAYGVAKIRYAADLEENPRAGQEIVDENGEPYTDENGETLKEPEELPSNERYCVERIHPDDFLWDEDASTLEETWSWVAHCNRVPLERAKKDKRYNQKALKDLKSKGEEMDDERRAREERKKGQDVLGRSERENPRKEKEDEQPEIVAIWEIYDLENHEFLTIAENGDVPLIMPGPIPKGIEDHPFEVLRFTLRDDSPYPLPPVSPLIDPAKEYNKARSDIQKHRKRFNRKYVASRQSFADDTAEISKVESGDDGTIVMANGDARGAIVPIQDAQLDPMRYNELGYLKAEMVELAGHNSTEAMGIASADSATQAGILDKRLEMKEGDAMSMVIDFTTNIARKLDQLVQIHIDREEAVKISGPQGEMWELVRPGDYDEIEGEYAYSVNTGATIPRMPHIERSSWQAFLTLLSGFPHLATSKRLMTKMAEMHHIEDDAMIDDLHQIAVKILSGQSPMPGQSGSQPGSPTMNPASASGGAAGGAQSMVKGNAAIGG